MKLWKVVLRLASLSVLEKIEKARFIAESITGNAFFPDPPFDPAPILEAALALEVAELATEEGGKDETATRNQKEFELVVVLNANKNLVENVANDDNEIGDIIILSAGMDVKQTGGRAPRVFNVENTLIEGRVRAETVSEGRAAYIWQFTETPSDAASWETVATTRVAFAVIKGLTPGIVAWFRVAPVLDEQGPWLGPISLRIT